MSAVRGRVVFAVTVSLTLHGLIVLAWLNEHEARMPSLPVESTAVDGPDDHEFVINLREPRTTTINLKPSAPNVEPPPPALLPDSIREPIPAGPLIHSVYSPRPSVSLPKSQPGVPLHGKQRPGTSIVYVLDHSSSMTSDGMLRKACDSIRASLGQLPTDCRFQIVAYNGGVDRLDSRLLLATIDNRERAERWLDTLVAEGSSDHRAGVREALSLHPDTIFVLTDADDLDEKEVRAIRVLLRERVCLTAAVFGGSRPKHETPLERLTREMGGEVKYVGP
jgi:hypothetical protein